MLNRRQKWYHNSRCLKKGDLVIVTDNSMVRSHWPLGRILTVYPGKDGVVRSVEVKTKSGTYIRPAASLALLEEEN